MDSTLSKAVKAAAAARLASASVRRFQMEQLRTAVRMHMGENHDRRQEVTSALSRLRSSWSDFRKQVRVKLRDINAKAAARRSRGDDHAG